MFRDGLSNTLLVGEKGMNADHYESGVDGSDDQSLYLGWDQDTVRFATAPWPLTQDQMGLDTQNFGGPHPGATQFVLCDGSVRPIAFVIDDVTFARLCNRSDGQALDSSSFE